MPDREEIAKDLMLNYVNRTALEQADQILDILKKNNMGAVEFVDDWLALKQGNILDFTMAWNKFKANTGKVKIQKGE
jgi:hypothetical protein